MKLQDRPADLPSVTRPARRVNTDPRFSRRRRSVQRSHRRRIVMRMVLLAGLTIAVWAAFFSSMFAVDRVEVLGASNTPMADVIAATGLDETDNLLTLSTDAVRRRVLELPWVKSVEVDRMLPGTVKVKLTERRPAVVLALGAARWTVDADGRVLQSGEVQDDLVVLAGIQIRVVEPGITLRTPEAIGALRVYRALPSSLKRRVVGIFAPSIERITLSLDDGVQVRYGAPEQLAAKSEVLTAVLARLSTEGTGARYIDVRVPTHPAVAPLDESTVPTP